MVKGQDGRETGICQGLGEKHIFIEGSRASVCIVLPSVTSKSKAQSQRDLKVGI
jgi:hypothetical protein